MNKDKRPDTIADEKSSNLQKRTISKDVTICHNDLYKYHNFGWLLHSPVRFLSLYWPLTAVSICRYLYSIYMSSLVYTIYNTYIYIYYITSHTFLLVSQYMPRLTKTRTLKRAIRARYRSPLCGCHQGFGHRCLRAMWYLRGRSKSKGSSQFAMALATVYSAYNISRSFIYFFCTWHMLPR